MGRVSRDFELYLYRQEMGISWPDLTGEWPQPRWRTLIDLWYRRLDAEVGDSRAPANRGARAGAPADAAPDSDDDEE